MRADTPSAREIAGKVGAGKMGIFTNDGGKEIDVKPGLAQNDFTPVARDWAYPLEAGRTPLVKWPRTNAMAGAGGRRRGRG